MKRTTPNPDCQQTPGIRSPRFWEIGEYGIVLDELLAFLQLALATKRLPFAIHHTGSAKHASSNQVVIQDSYPLDYYFIVMPDLMSVVMPDYAYSPLLDLFHTCFKEHRWLRHCRFRDRNAALAFVPMLEAEVFNDFVEMLRAQAQKKNIWLHMQRWKSETEYAQATSIKEFIPKLLSGGAHLEPIRVDFQYRESVFSLDDVMPYGQWVADESNGWVYVPAPAVAPSECPESRARIDSRVAMRDRARFFSNIYRDGDREIFQYLRGYISKMERGGSSRAYHVHVCFFFDARRPAHVTTEAVIAVISRRWSRVTGERGLVFNCHESSYRKKLRTEGRWDLDSLAGHNQQQVARLTNYLTWYFARDKGQSLHVKPTAKSRALTTAIGRALTKVV